jgi:hypothetical protein
VTQETIRLIEERRNMSEENAKKIDRLLHEPLRLAAFDEVQRSGDSFRLTPYQRGRVVEFKPRAKEPSGG